jgi:hypothetical protein
MIETAIAALRVLDKSAFPTADLETADEEAIREATVRVVEQSERERINKLLHELRYKMHWPVLATNGAALQPYFDVFCNVGRDHVVGFELDAFRERTHAFVLYTSVMVAGKSVPGFRNPMRMTGAVIRFAWRWKPYPTDYARGPYNSSPPTMNEYVLWAEKGDLMERMNNFRGTI